VKYPVLFTLRDKVYGKDFLANITLAGRALMTQEDGEWWLYGVCPGGLAQSGSNPEEAFANFRKAYKNILFDFAEDARSFDAFKNEVDLFYSQSDKEEETMWNEAFHLLRSGSTPTEEPFFAKLPKQKPEEKPNHLEVKRVKTKEETPSRNQFDVLAKAA
jgi:hypothetical protein